MGGSFKHWYNHSMVNKKRILYFVPTFPVLSETFIEREISKMVALGNVDITVIALAKGRGSMTANSERVTVFRRLDWQACIKATKYFLLKPFSLLQILTRTFGIASFNPKNFYVFLKAVGYAQIFEEYKPEHIHVHFLSEPSTIVLVVSQILDVPFSVSGHAKDVFLTGTLISQKVDKAKFVTICNTFAYNKCLEILHTTSNNKVHKIFHGIDPKTFEGISKLIKPNRIVLFMGGTRLVEKKGIKYMIEACRILKDMHIDFQLDLVGFGEMANEIIDLVVKQNLGDVVNIHGGGKGMPFEEVVEYYKMADIFLLPSIEASNGDTDGVPTVVIEAAMSKLPVISTNAGGVSDLIDSSNGIVVPQRDAKAIADAVITLIQNPDLRKTLGQKAYDKAVITFDLDKNIKQLEALLVA